jgi:hypothetical protein
MEPNEKPVEELEPKPLEEGSDQITVADEEPPAEGQTLDLDEEEATAKEFKALDNKAFAAMRKSLAEERRAKQEMEKRMAELEQKVATPVRAEAPAQYVPSRPRQMINGVAVPETREEWDALARKDWKLAVDMAAITSAQTVNQQVTKQQEANRMLEESKQEVISKHPELDDANSVKGRIFLQVLEKNPHYVNLPEGPILAMYKMEKIMKEQGMTNDQIYGVSSAAVAQREATRVSRASLTGAGRMPEKQGRTVTLSKDDLEFCKVQGLDPKEYAKSKLDLEAAKKGAQL